MISFLGGFSLKLDCYLLLSSTTIIITAYTTMTISAMHRLGLVVVALGDDIFQIA